MTRKRPDLPIIVHLGMAAQYKFAHIYILCKHGSDPDRAS